jgi:6-phosphogluconolactonase
VDREHKYLYAANEVETFEGKPDGSISVYAIDQRNGALKFLQRVSSGGWGPVYLSFDKTGKYLLVANYGAGSVAVFRVEKNGKLAARTSLMQHEGTKENPARPHSIRATNENRFVLVPDLALEQLFVYAFDEKTGLLSKTKFGSARVEKGSGPRHMAIGKSGKFVYMGNENSSQVTVFELNSSGELREVQSASTLPSGFKGENTTAEVLLDESGKHLYVSNRGDDSIAVFDVGDDGKLTSAERVPTGGKTPRGFALDPAGKWLLAANQASNTVAVFKVDPRNGRLTKTETTFEVISPVSLAFVPVSH